MTGKLFRLVTKIQVTFSILNHFKLIAKVEAEHEKRYRILLENIETGKVFEREEKVKWVCRKCGHVHEGTKALKNCPVCGHPEAYFEIEKTNY